MIEDKAALPERTTLSVSCSTQSAAILIVGNEILSGKVVDQNSIYLCRELRALGVDVRRISVVPDVPRLIGEEIQSCRHFDLVFTTGGVGPTHDDVTMEGVALGLGKALTHHPVLEEYLRQAYREKLNPATLRLAEVPEGTELINAEGLRFPVTRVENIYIFPGVPVLLRKKFDAIKQRFKGSPFFLKKIFLKGHEAEIAAHLNSTLHSFPELMLGSYPEWENPEYDLSLTLESKNLLYLERAHLFLLDLLPKEMVVRLE